jgi:hypothetical protein
MSSNINDIEDKLLDNKHILQTLVHENLNRKEKDYISYKDIKNLEKFEANLVNILSTLPEDILKQINSELN